MRLFAAKFGVLIFRISAPSPMQQQSSTLPDTLFCARHAAQLSSIALSLSLRSRTCDAQCACGAVCVKCMCASAREGFVAPEGGKLLLSAVTIFANHSFGNRCAQFIQTNQLHSLSPICSLLPGKIREPPGINTSLTRTTSQTQLIFTKRESHSRIKGSKALRLTYIRTFN